MSLLSRLIAGALAAVMTSGCASMTRLPASDYQVTIPILTARPRIIDCTAHGGPSECVVVLRSDFHALAKELKAACLANGQSHEECQAGE